MGFDRMVIWGAGRGWGEVHTSLEKLGTDLIWGKKKKKKSVAFCLRHRWLEGILVPPCWCVMDLWRVIKYMSRIHEVYMLGIPRYSQQYDRPFSAVFNDKAMIQILINHPRRSRGSTFLLNINWLNEWGRSCDFFGSISGKAAAETRNLFWWAIAWFHQGRSSLGIKSALATAWTRYATHSVFAIIGVAIAVILEGTVFFFLSSWI